MLFKKPIRFKLGYRRKSATTGSSTSTAIFSRTHEAEQQCRVSIVGKLSLSSPVACVTLLPRIAIGWKLCVDEIASYLVRFRDSAASATVGPPRPASWVYEHTSLCTQVKSQASAFSGNQCQATWSVTVRPE